MPIQNVRLKLSSLGYFRLIPFSVGVGETCPFLRQILQCEDRGDRTHRHTRPAIDTFVRINVQLSFRREVRLILARMNTINWTDINARCVFDSDARLRNNICHLWSPEKTRRLLSDWPEDVFAPTSAGGGGVLLVFNRSVRAYEDANCD